MERLQAWLPHVNELDMLCKLQSGCSFTSALHIAYKELPGSTVSGKIQQKEFWEKEFS